VRNELDRSTATLRWRFLAVGAVLAGAILIGTIGFRLVEGWPFFDAFYMALITLTTVGYGEVHPLSVQGRVFASFLMLVGVATVFVSLAPAAWVAASCWNCGAAVCRSFSSTTILTARNGARRWASSR
jgi:hypothetical protein